MLESFDMVQYHNGGHLYSDHALLQFGLNIDIHTNTGVLLQRAMNLGVSMHEIGSIKIDKTLRVSQCDAERVKQYFLENIPPVIQGNDAMIH